MAITVIPRLSIRMDPAVYLLTLQSVAAVNSTMLPTVVEKAGEVAAAEVAVAVSHQLLERQGSLRAVSGLAASHVSR